MAFLTPRYYVRRSATSRKLSSSSPDNISLDVARARALLEKSKAKLLQREQGTTAVLEQPKPIPFFATRLNGSKKRRQDVITDVNEAGLVRVNGAALAAWSEQEEWQSRSILEVFNETEQQEEEEVSDPFDLDSPRRLAASRSGSRRRDAPDRDVVAAIWNLRQSMRNEDFERIFDEKNRFIGEQ
jgi:hypothetical protein